MPASRIRCSVWKWSRPNVKVHRAPRPGTRCRRGARRPRRPRPRPPGGAAPDAVGVLAGRGRKRTSTPSKARAHRLAVVVAAACTTSAPGSEGARAGSRTISRCSTPRSASRAATRLPSPPVAPATPIMPPAGSRPAGRRRPRRSGARRRPSRSCRMCSRRLGDQPVAQRVVGQHALHPLGQRGGVARREAQADAAAAGHDLAQPAGVGDDARAAGGHRLERHEPERLVERRDHAQVGDRVERVQHRVVDPAEELAVRQQAELLAPAP